jgi:type II secretory pathway component GspD/PulD (secretin)
LSEGSNGNFNTPYINSRSANTVVVATNGQTIVIGGMMQDSKSVIDSQTPFLGSIPLLGNLFKHKESAIVKTELIIFVTPTVVNDPLDLARMSADETRRLVSTSKMVNPAERNRFIDPVMPVTPNGPPSMLGNPPPANNNNRSPIDNSSTPVAP